VSVSSRFPHLVVEDSSGSGSFQFATDGAGWTAERTKDQVMFPAAPPSATDRSARMASIVSISSGFLIPPAFLNRQTGCSTGVKQGVNS